MSFTQLSTALRGLASGLQIPVMLLLLLLIGLTVLVTGALVAEVFTERSRLRVKLPELIEALRAAADMPAVREVITGSGLLNRQKQALTEVTMHPQVTPTVREALALRLYTAEKERYERRLKLTDIIARLGPMLGLLGTLIPLGPGIIALGQGDTYTLSVSLMTAFDTTIAGLAAAALAFLISAVRRSWYGKYLSLLEMCLTCVLEACATTEPVGARSARPPTTND
jgi:biopolymer transport protein ExbB/TolQ